MYLAIDVGSTYIKFAVLDIHKIEIIKSSKIEPKRIIKDNKRFFEYDVQDMFLNIKSYIDRALIHYKIKGIIFSTQMHGFILEEKNFTTPYISWQDERCLCDYQDNKSYLEHLKGIISKEDMANHGVYLKPDMALCNLYAFVKQNGCESLLGYTFFTLGSYLIYRLTGLNCTHITNAAPTGLANIVNNSWNYDLIHKCGFDGLTLPDIKSDISICGYYKNIPVYPDIGDQQATILGSGTMPYYDLNVNIGTATQVSIITDRLEKPEIGEVRPYFDGLYLKTISGLTGGRALDVLVNFFKETIKLFTQTEIDDRVLWETIEKGIDIDPDISVDLGFYNSSPLSKGKFYNITPYNLDPLNIMAAAYINMAENIGENINLLKNNKTKRLVFSGGAAEKSERLINAICKYADLIEACPKIKDCVFYGLMNLVSGGLINEKQA